MGATSFLPPRPAQTGNKNLDLFFNDLFLYLTEVHRVLFGLSTDDGDIDEKNSPGSHDGRVGGHENLIQATDVTDKILSILAVTTADADVTYGVEEQALINEIKNVVNNLIAKHNTDNIDDNAFRQALRDGQIVV